MFKTLGEFGSYEWFDEDGELIAETDDEFYEYYYGDIINLYNEEEIDKLRLSMGIFICYWC